MAYTLVYNNKAPIVKEYLSPHQPQPADEAVLIYGHRPSWKGVVSLTLPLSFLPYIPSLEDMWRRDSFGRAVIFIKKYERIVVFALGSYAEIFKDISLIQS